MGRVGRGIDRLCRVALFASLPIACSAGSLREDGGAGSVTKTEGSAGGVVARSARPCAANRDGSRLATITNQARPAADNSAGLLSVRSDGNEETVASGQSVQCDTVEFAPYGDALAWGASAGGQPGGGFWGSRRDQPVAVSLSDGPGGGGINQIAFSPDGRWLAMLLATRAAPFAWNMVLRLTATDGLGAMTDVPITFNYGRVAFASDGALILSAISGDAYHVTGTMTLYRIDPATAAVQPLATVAGVEGDLFGLGEDEGGMTSVPRLAGNDDTLVYVARGQVPYLGTLVEDTPRGDDPRPLLDSVYSFTSPFGPGRKRLLASVWQDSGTADTWWDVDLEAARATQIPDVPPHGTPIPLGDGHRLLMATYGQVWSVWDRDTSQSLMDVGPWWRILWQSDDGRWLLGSSGAFSGPFSLNLVDVDGRTVRSLGDGVRARSVHVLDGRRVLFVRDQPSSDPDTTGRALVLASIDGGDVTVLAASVAPQIAVAGGRVFYAVDGTGAGDGIYSLTLPP